MRGTISDARGAQACDTYLHRTMRRTTLAALVHT